jgi:phosphatidylglycerophosphate synthase
MKSSLCALLVTAGLILLFTDYYFLSVLLMTGTFMAFIFQNKKSWECLPFYGLANLVTAFRFVLVMTLALLAETVLSGGLVFNVLILAIPLLDVLDGLIARYRKEESHFGMYFDMEVDAVFVMIASIIVNKIYPSMWIVLIPGFLRYFYKFTIDFFDRQGQFIESKQKYASVIAGTYFVATIVFFIFQNDWASLFLTISSTLIIFSFSISFYNFYKWSNGVKKNICIR